MIENLDVFRKNYLVGGLTDEQISEIASLAQVVKFMPNEPIIKIGEKSNDLFIILTGMAKILAATGDLLSDVQPAHVIGEVALIDDQPRSADVVAVGPVQAARIPAKQLRELLSKKREMGYVVLANLAFMLCGRLRKANVKIEHFANQDVWRGSL
jgi:CRP-like cAMP-binding protein